jgi:hypothetical protein
MCVCVSFSFALLCCPVCVSHISVYWFALCFFLHPFACWLACVQSRVCEVCNSEATNLSPEAIRRFSPATVDEGRGDASVDDRARHRAECCRGCKYFLVLVWLVIASQLFTWLALADVRSTVLRNAEAAANNRGSLVAVMAAAGRHNMRLVHVYGLDGAVAAIRVADDAADAADARRLEENAWRARSRPCIAVGDVGRELEIIAPDRADGAADEADAAVEFEEAVVAAVAGGDSNAEGDAEWLRRRWRRVGGGM